MDFCVLFEQEFVTTNVIIIAIEKKINYNTLGISCVESETN